MQPDTNMQAWRENESACLFGDNAQLVGVYTHACPSKPTQPCALYLTAGLLHHIGPHRLYVEMARSLAADGISGLRFDLAGVGDSETRSGGGDFAERSIGDVKTAMDYLSETFGHNRFVLIGLCSGADDALATAARDPRVVGTVLLNGYAYRAGQFLMHRIMQFYLPRLFSAQKVVNQFKKFTKRNPSRSEQQDTAALAKLDDDYRFIPPKSETAERIGSITSAGTQMLFIYTGSEHEEYTYSGQFFDMFPEFRDNSRVRELFIREADHTFVLRADRDKLIEKVRSWFSGVPFKRAA